jgi:AraC-like DNA-binding protein
LRKIRQSTPARRIVGIALRTNNTEAFRTMPAHWQRFASDAAPAQIPGKRSSDEVDVIARRCGLSGAAALIRNFKDHYAATPADHLVYEDYLNHPRDVPPAALLTDIYLPAM